MKKSNLLIFMSLLFLTSVSLSSCSESDDDDEKEFKKSERGMYVLNEGVWNNNNSSISYCDLDSSKVIKDGFYEANSRLLGDVAQDMIIYGSKMYVTVNTSNTIEILDAKSLKTITTIVPKSGEPQSPRYLASDKGKVFVSMYDGYVSVIDTNSFAVEKNIKVGPNPEQMVIANGYLYVTNSDGLNYSNNYANGKSVSKIDLETMEEIKKIEVGLNPMYIDADDNGNVYVLSIGNYSDIQSDIQKIDANDNVTSLNIEASIMCVNSKTLYIINAPYGSNSIDYFSYSLPSCEKINNSYIKSSDLPENPHCISFDAESGNIYVGSYFSMSDYTSEGFVYEYDSNGIFLNKYNVGIGPRKIIFTK